MDVVNDCHWLLRKAGICEELRSPISVLVMSAIREPGRSARSEVPIAPKSLLEMPKKGELVVITYPVQNTCIDVLVSATGVANCQFTLRQSRLDYVSKTTLAREYPDQKPYLS